MNYPLNGAAEPLDCTTPIDALLELMAMPGHDDAIIPHSVLTTTPDWDGPRFDWPPLFSQLAHGSTAHLMPEKVYAFTSVAQAEDVPELGALSTLYRTFIVGPRMKAVIDSFDIPNSELFPIGMVLRYRDRHDWAPGDDPDRKGGGAVVEDRHWLWHLYSRYDLVDWEQSEKEPYWIVGPRDDLPGSPMQRFSMVNNKHQLVLFSPPYAESAVFQILGSSSTFVSPNFAYAMSEAGVLMPSGSERYVSATLWPYYLDRPRQVLCDRRRSLPAIRILGTDMLMATTNEPPFRSVKRKQEQR